MYADIEVFSENQGQTRLAAEFKSDVRLQAYFFPSLKAVLELFSGKRLQNSHQQELELTKRGALYGAPLLVIS